MLAIEEIGKEQCLKNDQAPSLNSREIMVLVASIHVDEEQSDKNGVNGKDEHAQGQIDFRVVVENADVFIAQFPAGRHRDQKDRHCHLRQGLEHFRKDIANKVALSIVRITPEVEGLEEQSCDLEAERNDHHSVGCRELFLTTVIFHKVAN